MKVNLPIPSGWKLLFEALYRRVYEKINSPMTKLTVLAMLVILFTRQEVSFSISINEGGIFKRTESSVFTSYAVDGPTTAKLVSFKPAKKEWTEKELRQLEYVKQYKDIALREMEENGIPASITLAQGLLESGTGKSTLATKNNNHFGIKCFSKKCAKGHCSNHSDDHHKDFFLNFKNPEESYRAHGKLLQKSRYRKLFDLKPNDYKGWARGLKSAGYATDPKYADKLIRMIESLELYRFDA